MNRKVIGQRLRHWATIESVAGAMGVIAGVALFLMMAIMTAHVIGRKFGEPIPGAFEASEQLIIIVFSFPLAAVGLRKGHIVFELVTNLFPPAFRTRLEVVIHILLILLFGLLTWKALEKGWQSFLVREYRQAVIDFPIWPFRIALAIGLVAFTVQLVVSWLRLIREFTEGRKKPADLRESS